MNEFLEKLFHTKLGIGTLVGVAVLTFVVFCGCSNGDVCNCGCARYTCITCSGCDDCGCTGDCSDCANTICTVCGCGYRCEILNSDGRLCSDDSIDVYVTMPIEKGKERFGTHISYIKKGESLGYNGEGYKYFNESVYFEIDGFYCDDVLVMDGDGIVINERKLKNAVNNYRVDLTLKVTEKKLGEKILVRFTSEYSELALNPVIVTNGEVVDFFPTPELEGKTFMGWREAGSAKASVMIKSGMEFHLYLANAGLENTITLEPVFRTDRPANPNNSN